MHNSSDSILRFAPWTSDVDISFFTNLAHQKLMLDKLNDTPSFIWGYYTLRPTDAPQLSCRLHVFRDALPWNWKEHPSGISLYIPASGWLKNFNTFNEYQSANRSAIIESAGQKIFTAITDSSIYANPSLLTSFFAIFFADLKRYHFYHHFAFPALHSALPWYFVDTLGDALPLNDSNIQSTSSPIKRTTRHDMMQLLPAYNNWANSVDPQQRGFFIAKRQPRNVGDQLTDTPTNSFSWDIATLQQFDEGFFDSVDPVHAFVGFVDPSTYPSNPGWMLRNLLFLIQYRWKLNTVQILCLRDPPTYCDKAGYFERNLDAFARSIILSLQIKISIPTSVPTNLSINSSLDNDPLYSINSSDFKPRITGWERNLHNKPASKVVNLAEHLDPLRLADQAVDLNLNLMKWRLAPHLDLEVIKHSKCLLLGAGTLGCYVARNLLAWGVRHVYFVDNGRVSYSNPVRQPLFKFVDCHTPDALAKDCVDESLSTCMNRPGANKASCAAAALREIYPGVESQGYNLTIPMLGHTIGNEDTSLKNMKRDWEKLDLLMAQHDAIFLLLDTREARWLPTVMGKANCKIVMNAALGFDSFLVMRHGGLVHTSGTYENVPAKQKISLGELGCYFCSDVVAAGNSLKNAALDQQCTVTRPGCAPIAAALCVELFVSILQSNCELSSEHPLGDVPHMIRGNLPTYKLDSFLQGIPAFPNCSACSANVIKEYEQDKWNFIIRAVQNPQWVEDISGLTAMKNSVEGMTNNIEWIEEPLNEEDLDEGWIV